MSIRIDKLKFGFVHIPKNGGTSIRTWIYDTLGRINVTEVGFHSTLPELELPSDFKSIAIIRNPWDRMVSYYSFCKILQNRNILNQPGPKLYGIPQPYPDFETFLSNVHNVYFEPSIEVKGRHPFWFTPVTPQSVWIHKDPTILIRYEELEKGFKQIQTLANNYKPIPKLNQSIHKPYRDYYNDKTKSIVEKLFAIDIERWKYTF